MADSLELTTVTPLRPWYSTKFSVFQGTTDYADFQFTLANGTGKKVLRLLANGDIRFYGELLLDDGALRSVNAFSFTAASGGLIASFRTGSDPSGIGTEVYNFDGSSRLTVVGRLVGASRTSPTLVLDGAPAGGRAWSLQSNADTGTLDVAAAPLAGAEVRWGVDGAGIDQRWYGETASASLLWDQSADALTRNGAAVDLHTQAGTGTGVVIDMVGPDLTQGVQSVVFESTVTFTSPGQTERALMSLPANSVVDWVQANVESALTVASGNAATFSIGIPGDVDSYGTAWASGAQADLLAKDSKANFIGSKTAAGASMGVFVASAVSIKVFAAATGGTTLATANGFNAGSVKVRIGYRTLLSIANA